MLEKLFCCFTLFYKKKEKDEDIFSNIEPTYLLRN